MWLAATIDRRAFERAQGVGADEAMPAVSPIGHAAERRSVRESLMRRNMKSDGRAPFESLFRGGFGHPLGEAEAGGLLGPLQMVRWSPSATNKQPCRLVIDGGKVHFHEHRARGYARESTGDIQRVDMGIAACHFQAAADEAGLPGEFLKEDPGLRMNCLPFLGHGNRSPGDGRLSMSVDLRCRHGRSPMELAAGTFDEGRGCESVAKSPGIPAKAVRKWQQTYRAVGRDGLPEMGKKHARCNFETKVAAARAVVDDGMSKPGAMERFGIASSSPLDRWCRPYREGGAEAPRPKPKGRPRGSGAKGAPMTREQEPGREAGRLEAQVAYPRKPMAPEAELRSRTGRRP